VERSERFYDLLFKMGAIALMCDFLTRAVDRLELLLRISEGKFKGAEAHYRCGIAYRKLAELEGTKEKQSRENKEREREKLHRTEKVALYEKAQSTTARSAESNRKR
jgi:hypothetical protein